VRATPLEMLVAVRRANLWRHYDLFGYRWRAFLVGLYEVAVTGPDAYTVDFGPR